MADRARLVSGIAACLAGSVAFGLGGDLEDERLQTLTAGIREAMGAPLPRARPEDATVPVEEAREPAEPREHDAVCIAALANLAVTATLQPPLQEGVCGIATPLEIARVGDGLRSVEMRGPALVDCSVARPFSDWLLGPVQTAAIHHLGQRVTGVAIGGYACRGRNNVSTAPLSEHSFGRAIDITAFRLEDDNWLPVEIYPSPSGNEGAFLDDVQTAACGPFTTTLGPGIPEHDDHLHFDLATREGGGLYCR